MEPPIWTAVDPDSRYECSPPSGFPLARYRNFVEMEDFYAWRIIFSDAFPNTFRSKTDGHTHFVKNDITLTREQFCVAVQEFIDKDFDGEYDRFKSERSLFGACEPPRLTDSSIQRVIDIAHEIVSKQWDVIHISAGD